jgi:hypothetical protein
MITKSFLLSPTEQAEWSGYPSDLYSRLNLDEDTDFYFSWLPPVLPDKCRDNISATTTFTLFEIHYLLIETNEEYTGYKGVDTRQSH